jgi:hypothetical protein
MDDDDKDVADAKKALTKALRSSGVALPFGSSDIVSDAIEALIAAKLVALINELSERIEHKLGVVV